jgi:hypothetical protein
MTLFALTLYRPTADRCGQVCSSLLYSGVLSSNLSLETKVMGFFSVTPGKCCNHTSLQPATTSFHISVLALFINDPAI